MKIFLDKITYFIQNSLVINIHTGRGVSIMGCEHKVRIMFSYKNKYFNNFEDFLTCFPEIQLTQQQIFKIKEFLTSFSCTVIQEWEAGYDLGDSTRGFLPTQYLCNIISISDEGRTWYLTPITGIQLFFRGLELICIYNISQESIEM